MLKIAKTYFKNLAVFTRKIFKVCLTIFLTLCIKGLMTKKFPKFWYFLWIKLHTTWFLGHITSTFTWNYLMLIHLVHAQNLPNKEHFLPSDTHASLVADPETLWESWLVWKIGTKNSETFFYIGYACMKPSVLIVKKRLHYTRITFKNNLNKEKQRKLT